MRRSVQLAAIGLIAASGCFSGGYDADYRSSLQRYREEGEFQQLHQEPKALAGGRLRLRVPKALGIEDPVGEKNVPKPPFLKEFPEFAMALSEEPKGDAAKSQAVLFLGALTDNGSSQEEIKKKILNQVQKEASFAKAAWSAVDVQPISGGTVPWSVLKLVGSQRFDRINNGIPESNNLDAETQIWVASDTDKKGSAVLVWRVPQERAATVPLEKLAGLVARTVEFEAAAEPAAAAAAAAAPEAAK